MGCVGGEGVGWRVLGVWIMYGVRGWGAWAEGVGCAGGEGVGCVWGEGVIRRY